MTQRDDMVFAPDIGPQRAASARVRAREDRALARARKRGGVLSKLRSAHQISRLRPMSRAARSASRVGAFARSGAAGAARGASRLGARALATPIGAIAGAVLVAGVVALRLATGEPLEGTGAMVNRMILGDMDDTARAKTATRQQLQGDSELTRIVGVEGKANSQIVAIADDLFKLNKRDELGASLLREAFPANSTLDILIARAAQAFRDAWVGADGPGATAQFKAKYKSARNIADGKASGR